MDEVVLYVESDSTSSPAMGLAVSLHSLNQFASFRDSSCTLNGAVSTGMGDGAKLLTALSNKALLQVHSWGKEGVDQRIPIPEALKCLAMCMHPSNRLMGSEPWLCAGGSASGKVYVWEYALGALFAVVDAHYQGVLQISFSLDSSYMVTAGMDARASVWRVCDLLQMYQQDRKLTPFYAITDHSLDVTGTCLVGASNDVRLYTTLRDATLRVYNVPCKTLLATFILPRPAECLAVDPANRQVYVGLDDGRIRAIPLYRARNSVLESVVGARNIITVESDNNLEETFVHHQQMDTCSTENPSVTTLALSFDATVLVSGDSLGRVMAADVATRQVTRTFTSCNSPIAYIKVSTCARVLLEGKSGMCHPNVMPFKRVLESPIPMDHVLTCKIPKNPCSKDLLFEQWLSLKSKEETAWKHYSLVDSTIYQASTLEPSMKFLQLQLSTVSTAYSDLQEKYEQLLKKHS